MKPGARDSTDTGVSSSRGTLVSPGGSFRAANGNIIGLRYISSCVERKRLMCLGEMLSNFDVYTRN